MSTADFEKRERTPLPTQSRAVQWLVGIAGHYWTLRRQKMKRARCEATIRKLSPQLQDDIGISGKNLIDHKNE